MQYVDRCLSFDFLPVASNDNDDLLAIDTPQNNLAVVRALKNDMRAENSENGLLLRSRKQRRFFQEIVDAERYITLRYFSAVPDMNYLAKLKRRILDLYLFPCLKPMPIRTR